MHAMCNISETVSEVNQIRTERHAHALEYLQLPWKPSWRQTVGEARHLMSLSSVFISSSRSPFSPLLYLSVHLSRSQSTMSRVTRLCFSGCCRTSAVRSQIEHIILMCGVSLCFCVASFTATFSCHPFPSPSSLFIRLKQCNSRSPDATSCKLPGSPRPPRWRTLSPALGCGTESNLAGVTEVRLECSHFSTGANFVHINGLRVTASKNQSWMKIDWSYCIPHCALSLLFFLFLIPFTFLTQVYVNVALKACRIKCSFRAFSDLSSRHHQENNLIS